MVVQISEKRNRPSLQRRSTAVQNTPDDMNKWVIDFLLFANRFRKNCVYPEADKIDISVEAVSDMTIKMIGSKSVPVINSILANHDPSKLFFSYYWRQENATLNWKKTSLAWSHQIICMLWLTWHKHFVVAWAHVEKILVQSKTDGLAHRTKSQIAWCELFVKSKITKTIRTDIAFISTVDTQTYDKYRMSYIQCTRNYEKWMKSSGISDENRAKR